LPLVSASAGVAEKRTSCGFNDDRNDASAMTLVLLLLPVPMMLLALGMLHSNHAGSLWVCTVVPQHAT